MEKQNILGLRTVIYKVKDLAAAKDWYTKVFGTTPYFDQPFYVGFNIGGYELGLHPEEGPVNRGDAVVAYWGVEDISSEYNRWLNLGASGHESPQNVGGDIMVATLKDPWNNVIGLIYNPGFSVEGGG